MRKITQHRRTLNDVLRYIQMKHQNGVLRKSMMEMAKETGYSNATICRALKALEAEGMIQSIPAKQKRKPNIIVYLGSSPETVDYLMKQAQQCLCQLEEALHEVQSTMNQLQEALAFLDVQKDYIELH